MTGLAAGLLTGSIRLYQLALSPWLGPACRFQPTCSEYALEAIAEWGVAKGGWRAIRRLGRCHPLGGSGYDPIEQRVPDGS